jgi:hypothetical protein
VRAAAGWLLPACFCLRRRQDLFLMHAHASEDAIEPTTEEQFGKIFNVKALGVLLTWRYRSPLFAFVKARTDSKKKQKAKGGIGNC